jgi:hypothetical protein
MVLLFIEPTRANYFPANTRFLRVCRSPPATHRDVGSAASEQERARPGDRGVDVRFDGPRTLLLEG